VALILSSSQLSTPKLYVRDSTSIFAATKLPLLSTKRMGKAKKVRKFAATKRVLNTTKDTRLKENKAKITKAIEQKKEKDGELVREMYIFLFSKD
jgi:hypothetical protein